MDPDVHSTSAISLQKTIKTLITKIYFNIDNLVILDWVDEMMQLRFITWTCVYIGALWRSW